MPDAPSPVLTRRAMRLAAAPATLDREAGTVTATVSSGARVSRPPPAPNGAWSPWLEDLDLKGARLSPADGVPLLLDHTYLVDNLVGTVSGLRRDATGLAATLRFSTGQRPRDVFEKVADGTLTGVSMGYRAAAWTPAPAVDGVPLFVVSGLEIIEISLTPFPADPAGRVRSITMKEMTSMPDTNVPPSGDDLTLRADRERVSGIRSISELASRSFLPADVIQPLERAAIAGGMTLDAYRAQVFEAGVQADANVRAPTPRAFIGMSHDSPDRIRSRMADALAARVAGTDPGEAARPYRGMTMAGLASELAQAGGSPIARRNAGAAEIITRALTTSDFPLLLQQAGSRVLEKRLVAAPGAARLICAARSVPDFRTGTFLQAAGVTDLSLLGEGGEIKHSAPAERGESYAVQTFARGLFFSRQALVNDDLGAFDQVTLFANGVVATEANEFVKMFVANGAGWGPTMADGLPLFHASHGNVAVGTVSTAGISAARIVMRAQKDAGGNLIAPEPRVMLVGPAGETAGEQVLAEIATVATTEANRPVFAGRLLLGVEPRLSGAPWFLFADPALAPMLAMVTLNGTGGIPQISDHTPDNRDGLTYKVTHDFTIAPMSYVGAVRVTGA
ncbi:HK97 family phage prohead protease [Humitalea sp. 24SJ18S-53]|uniref:phage major capsid protein n=1 Tax=Humitalea sp. 24SJ18S-53 TaxID=3422307 RepID=UPI003D67BF21